MHVLVLLGGDSAERNISLQSGAAVARALEARGHQVTQIDPAESPFSPSTWPHCDVVFIALHGTFGEDGQVQRILEQAGLPYTGSNAIASRLAFHKSQAQKIFEQHHIPTPASYLFDNQTSLSQVKRFAEELGYPLFVKPDAQGSSLGVSRVNKAGELQRAIEHCLEFDSLGLIQKAIAGSEWTLGIFDEIVFPVIQIRFKNHFYDHQAKYEEESTTFILDQTLSPQILQNLISIGKKTYQSLGACGVARVDMILDDANRAWVLELNTIPGMTDHSTVPKAAKKLGWSFESLCEKICQAAINSHSR